MLNYDTCQEKNIQTSTLLGEVPADISTGRRVLRPPAFDAREYNT